MRESALHPRLRPALALADLVALAVAFWLAHLLRFYPGRFAGKWQDLQDHPGFLAWAVASAWILCTAAELYEPEVLKRRAEVPVRVLVVVALWSTMLVLVSYLGSSRWQYGRGLLAITAAIWILGLLLSRRFAGVWLTRRRREPALVVGDPSAVGRLCHELSVHPAAPWEPIDASHLAAEDLPAEVVARKAGLVVVADSGVRGDVGTLHLTGVPVVTALDVWAWLEERLPLNALPAEVPAFQPGLGTVHGVLVNRVTGVVNVVLAVALGVLSLPLLAAGALLVVLADGFPVFYHQERVGQFGRRFTIYKLRTMVRDAEVDGPEFAAENDPRTLAPGRLLRRLRIDELPQIWNVLRGEMALVGPRPERPEFLDELVREIPYYTWRLSVRPGCTGWAQVNLPYARDLEGHRRKLEFDLYFIRERSLRLHALILLRTLSAVLVGSRGPSPIPAPAPAGKESRAGAQS